MQLTIWDIFLLPISQGIYYKTSLKFSFGNKFSK